MNNNWETFTSKAGLPTCATNERKAPPISVDALRYLKLEALSKRVAIEDLIDARIRKGAQR